MTGFGEARWQGPALTVGVELRSVNNRFLKISIKSPEAYQFLESDIERTIREKLKRGTVYVQLWVQREPRVEDYQINALALKSYLQQLDKVASEWKRPLTVDLGAMHSVPGVVTEAETLSHHDIADDWALVGPVLEDALNKLQAMRGEEGRKMARELNGQAQLIAQELAKIQERAPGVVTEYRKRLHDKMQSILAEQGMVLDPATLVREIAVFAERSDINEEIVRLESHLEQFQAFLNEAESTGRKFDFLIQEMNREINTIGSKANDVLIARHVVEMKGAIERMREMIQNVE
jgi:uncharacterized protein (TIGR00255 family)